MGDRYELIRQLAVGGMGEVFLAIQRGPRGFARPVVVKRILSHLAHDETFVQQFLNEGRLAARISHPSVVQILELDQSTDGAWYLVLEYVHGVTLRALLKDLAAGNQGVPLELAAWVCAQALHGLAAAHELRDEHGSLMCLVHRDVSPDNLMMSYGGAVKVLDFGIAKAMAVVSSTRPGMVKGKLPYMAPEVFSDEHVTPSADLYAMGVVLYEIAARRRPFTATNDAALMRQVLDVPAPPLEGVDPVYAALVARALEKAPGARFSSAREMASALEQFAAAKVVGPSALVDFLREQYGDVPAPRPQDEIVVPLGTMTFERPGEEPASTGPHSRGPRSPRRVLFAALAVGTLIAAGAVLRPSPSPSPTPSPTQPERQPTALAEGPVDEAPLDAGPPMEPVAMPRPLAPLPSPGATPDAGLRRVAARGTLRLFVQPWAEVSIDRQPVGVTPLAPLSLAPGRHQVRLSNPQLGVTRLETVVIEAGKVRTLRVSLQAP
ncbi:MAG: serine/threonine-protein kinase [Myxococcales bacterium]|nr:serine/threonine-protein kinase [Myxococcales bacterium]